MIGKLMEFASSSVFWAGFVCALLGAGIVIRRDSQRYLQDSELLKIVTSLTATWRTKNKGWSFVAVVGILLMVCLAVAGTSGYFKLEQKSYPVVELHDVYVEQEVGEFGYTLLSEGIEYNGIFCDTLGYKPPFSRSMTIKLLKFRNTGECWDMRDMHPKYIMETDRHGIPICPLCEENPTIKEN